MIGRDGDGEAPSRPRAAARRTDSSHRSDDEPIRRVRALDFLGTRRTLQIEHEGEVYTLRLTRNNRLILTK